VFAGTQIKKKHELMVKLGNEDDANKPSLLSKSGKATASNKFLKKFLHSNLFIFLHVIFIFMLCVQHLDSFEWIYQKLMC